MVRIRMRQRRIGSQPGMCPYCGSVGVSFQRNWWPVLQPRGWCRQCEHMPVFESHGQVLYLRGLGMIGMTAASGITLGLLAAAFTGIPVLRMTSVLIVVGWAFWAARRHHARIAANCCLMEQEDPFIDALYESVRDQIWSPETGAASTKDP
ncbi:MAG: hypothetical protein ACOCXA_01805 [Planctomycetota bacterium]